MSEATGFLYPFIDSEERDASRLLVELATSAREKFVTSQELRATTLEGSSGALRRAGTALADAFRHGGRLFAFGNGGSATDAEGAVELFRHPPRGRPLPAVSLVDDQAVLTALANDVGFDLVFARQVIAHGRPGDMAIGFSTSGNSVSVLTAFEESARRGLLTIGFSGYDGGAMASSGAIQHCLVVRSDSVHRIQETQDGLLVELWSLVQNDLASDRNPS
jgi:D-sedoheptulose 7-phosphate isomerase